MSSWFLGDWKRPCRWPGCRAGLEVAMWGCKRHWYQLPIALRNRLYWAFRPGQELHRGCEPPAWREAEAEIQRWIRDNEAPARMVG